MFGAALRAEGTEATLVTFDRADPSDFRSLEGWVSRLRQFGVFFCEPLDLDYTMLMAFFDAYQRREPGMRGPREGDARSAVLGDEGLPALYDASHDAWLRWYRYLFLGRGKPSTHVRVLSALEPDDLKAGMPDELKALLDHVMAALNVPPAEGVC